MVSSIHTNNKPTLLRFLDAAEWAWKLALAASVIGPLSYFAVLGSVCLVSTCLLPKSDTDPCQVACVEAGIVRCALVVVGSLHFGLVHPCRSGAPCNHFAHYYKTLELIKASPHSYVVWVVNIPPCHRLAPVT